MSESSTPRSHQLVALAAEAMDDGRDPFHQAFLVEHGVTLDEVYEMSEQLALVARLLLILKKPAHHDKLVVLLAENIGGEVTAAAVEHITSMRRVTKGLCEFNASHIDRSGAPS